LETLTEFFNRRSEMEKRRTLRNAMTRAEAALWCRLRRQQIADARFRRQYSIGPYVLDFYCPRLKLAIEVDGDSHYSDTGVVHDRKRQAYLEQFGVRVLRFTNDEVFRNTQGILELIWQTVREIGAGDPP